MQNSAGFRAFLVVEGIQPDRGIPLVTAPDIVTSTYSCDPLVPWIWQHLRRYQRRVITLAALSASEIALRLLSPWPMKAIVDFATGQNAAPAWLGAVAAMAVPVMGIGARERLIVTIVSLGLLLQVGHQLVMMCHSRLSAATGHRMVADLREELFTHIQALALAHHDQTPTGDSLHRIESDAMCVEHLLLRGLFPVFFSALTLAVMFVVLAMIDLQLAIVAAAIVPCLYGWLRFYTRRMRPVAVRAKALDAALVQRLHESLSSIRLVKTYAREDLERARFAQAATSALDARVASSRQEAFFGTIVSTLTIAGTSLVVLAGGLSVVHGRITLGTLLVLVAYLGYVYGPLCGIANTAGALQHASASARRVRETLAIAPESADTAAAIEAPADLRGTVVFDRVSFGYRDERPVLNGLSFTAHPGETIALVGLSGAGKSTAVSLIARLYDPTAGRVLIDGRNVGDYTRASLRRRVAVVLQDAIMMSGTVRENLRYGRLEATDAEIEAAARAAHAHDFIMSLPDGYDTVLGERGNGLSGGQRQRLNVARAFVKNAPILILDEPTAALDALSEELVFTGLRSLQAGRTTFVIAHRLSTVRDADRILVLDGGVVVAEGRHDSLLTTSALYARLAASLTETRVTRAA